MENNSTAGKKPEDAMVTEARRLFGRTAAGDGMVGPVQHGLPVRMAGGGTRCAWSGAPADGADLPTVGVVAGIVRSETSGRPLPGAFLQLLGSGFATFADDAGRYRLTFDPSLVDRCRSQLVRVSAPGYRARTLILGLGALENNTIDLAARH